MTHEKWRDEQDRKSRATMRMFLVASLVSMAFIAGVVLVAF